jgi:hypothetical protein
MTALAAAACVFRFLQLYRYTDSQTGFVSGHIEYSYIVYGLFALCIAAASIPASKCRREGSVIHFRGNRSLHASMLILSAAFFFDFVHQCYNVYLYLDTNAYIEYNYLIPLALSGVCSLTSTFYVYFTSLTVKGLNYDINKLTVLNFAPFLWAFLRLVIIMVSIVDIRAGVESFCEFLYLASLSIFLLCSVSAIDRGDGSVTGLMVSSAYTTCFAALVAAVPRLLMMLIHKGELLSRVTFSCITYLATVLFAYEIMMSITVKNNSISDN